MPKKRPIYNIAGILFISGNIVYLCLIGILPGLEGAMMAGGLQPLTKLWLLNLAAYIGLDGLRQFLPIKPDYFIDLLICVNAATIIGLAGHKAWGKRCFNVILTAMCLFSLFWTGMSVRSTGAMTIYMQRSYNAWVYNNYWEPLKRQFCPDCGTPENPVTQYEPIYHLDPKPFPGSYREARAYTEQMFSGQNEGAPGLAPAYWGLFRVTTDAFETSQELYRAAFVLASVLFYIWFLILPAGLLYAFNRREQ